MLIEQIEKDGYEFCTYDSSNIKASQYHALKRELIIEFSSGKKYKYEDQSYYDYLKFKNAKSQGSVFHSDIIKRNKGTLITEEELINITNNKQDLLNDLEKSLDDALAKETKESLTKFLEKQRKNDNNIDNNII